VKSRIAGLLMAITMVGVLTSCSRDGRELAPALPEQNESIAIAPTQDASALTPSDSFAVSGPWMEGGDIDLTYTCYGSRVSPAIQISGQPSGTVAMALTLHDVEFPDDLLWVMANISGGTVAIGEASTPPDVVIATNSEGATGYAAPCPAAGARRQYLLTLFAMDALVDAAALTDATGAVDADALLTAVEQRTFDLAESTFYVQAP
jgi:phosphatidylethanolamine-binding protein (PEBP) family uncharacterized protein